MVSYPLDFPTELTVNQLRITSRNAVARSMSSFSYAEQVYDFSGEAWHFSGSMPLMNRDSAEAYVCFFTKLKGRRGTFLFPLPSPVATPRGSWGGTPLVNGAGQTGNTLNIDGLPANTVNVVRQGDFINLGTGSSTRLYKVLDNADSNASGEATLTIWPSLRSSPGDNAAVTYQNVKVLLRSENDIPMNFDISRFYSMSFDALEALNGT